MRSKMAIFLYAPVTLTHFQAHNLFYFLSISTHLEASLAVIIKAAVIVWSRPIALWVL